MKYFRVTLLSFLLALPCALGMTHPDHDLSEFPEMEELDVNNDWIGGYQSATGGYNSKFTFTQLYKLLFPLVAVKAAPGYSNYGSGGSPKLINFDNVIEKSMPDMFDIGNPSRLVATRSGLYEFFGDLWVSGELSHAEAYDYKIRVLQVTGEGTKVVGKASRNDLTKWRALRVRGVAELEEGDYIKMDFWHNQGSGLGAGRSLFMQRIGPLPAPE